MEKKPTDSGADGTNANPEINSVDQGKKDSVSYETHTRLLEQRKKDQEKLRETNAQLESLLKEKADREKQELEQQGNYKKMLELREKEVSETKQRLSELESRWTNSMKLSAVISKLPGKVEKSQYLGFIDLDKVAIDPDTQEVDVASAESAASEFVKSFPELIKADGKKLPSHSANGGQAGITYEQWRKLPLSEKKKYKPSDINGGK
jgi:predicted nuclease with TOPRIM domain